MSRTQFLKAARTLHLYVGVFLSPALLFFAFTGAIQSFGLHETNRDHPNYTPAHWIVVLSQIHKEQTALVPVRRPRPPSVPPASAARSEMPKRDRPHDESAGKNISSVSPTATPAGPPGRQQAPAIARARHPLPLRIFFVTVCIGLFTSTFTGLVMSYRYLRNKPLISTVLLAGVLVPLLLLFV